MREITEERIIELIKKHSAFIFSDLEENLCLEHYNSLHKTNYTENDIVLNQTECWFCKQIKDRQS